MSEPADQNADETTQASVLDEPSEPEPVPDPVGEARAEAAKMKEQWVRTAADFDNFRKRARKEIEDARKGGREEILKELLPVFDNLERAGSMAMKATDLKAVSDGVGMILKQFLDTLGRIGITRVPTKGASFDPQMHEAIQQVESDEPAGTVLSEVQPGYMTPDGRLVRAALVVVAKPRAGKAASVKPAAASGESDPDVEGMAVETPAGGSDAVSSGDSGDSSSDENSN